MTLEKDLHLSSLFFASYGGKGNAFFLSPLHIENKEMIQKENLQGETSSKIQKKQRVSRLFR